jgi:hypothetical protein
VRELVECGLSEHSELCRIGALAAGVLGDERVWRELAATVVGR